MEWCIHSSPTWMIDRSWPPHFNKALVTSINTFYWGEDLEPPRSMEASSSSLLQLPSCGEGIQTRKNWLNTNWQVIDATATSKEVAGTDNGASSRLNISIFDGAMASSSSFLIASEQNKLSTNHVLVFITHYFVCLLSVNQGTALHMNRKPWTHSKSCRCGRLISLLKTCSTKQDERNSVWGLHLF